MNSLVKVPPYSKLNFQGKNVFTQNWCNITLNIQKKQKSQIMLKTIQTFLLRLVLIYSSTIREKHWNVKISKNNIEMWKFPRKTLKCEHFWEKHWNVNISEKNIEMWTFLRKTLKCEHFWEKHWNLKSKQTWQKWWQLLTWPF